MLTTKAKFTDSSTGMFSHNPPEMSEPSVTYVDLRFHTPTEKKRKRKPKHPGITEIRDQEVTYSNPKFHNPSEQQRQPIPTSAESKDSRSPSSLWFITVILGLPFLALLATAGVLGAMFLQASHQVTKQTEEIIQEREDFRQNVSQLMETLKNCTQQRDELQTQNADFSKLSYKTGDNCSSCPEGWIQHKGKCYHFTKERRTWQESKEYCSSHGSRLLRTENEEEVDFINGLACFHWIGLSYNGTAVGWAWEDGTSYSTDLFQVRNQEPGGSCALWHAGGVSSYVCTTPYRFICEKRVA